MMPPRLALTSHTCLRHDNPLNLTMSTLGEGEGGGGMIKGSASLDIHNDAGILLACNQALEARGLN